MIYDENPQGKGGPLLRDFGHQLTHFQQSAALLHPTRFRQQLAHFGEKKGQPPAFSSRRGRQIKKGFKYLYLWNNNPSYK